MKKKKAIISITTLTIIIVSIVGIYFSGILSNTLKNDVDIKLQKEYPSIISNDYVWKNGINVDYKGMGEYVIKQGSVWYNFVGIQKNKFKQIGDTQWFKNEGTSYYYKGMPYRFPPSRYDLRFNYDTNKLVIDDL